MARFSIERPVSGIRPPLLVQIPPDPRKLVELLERFGRCLRVEVRVEPSPGVSDAGSELDPIALELDADSTAESLVLAVVSQASSREPRVRTPPQPPVDRMRRPRHITDDATRGDAFLEPSHDPGPRDPPVVVLGTRVGNGNRAGVGAEIARRIRTAMLFELDLTRGAT